MEGTLAPEQIIINGQEYSSEDATQLIELGSKYKKMESELNTSLDKVYPEYTRKSQLLAEKEKLLAERDEELKKYRTQQEDADKKANTPEDVQKARAAAREIGLADEDFLKEKGYMTKGEIDAYFSEKTNLQKQTDQVLKEASELEKQIDGSDGRVPFDQKSVLAYANVYQKSTLMEAYDEMNTKANAKWKEAQIAAEERPGLTTLKPGGKKEPVKPKYTNDNIGSAISEWLEGI